MNTHVPFAVVGSTDFVRVGNKMMRSRQYPWGTVQGKVLNFIQYLYFEAKIKNVCILILYIKTL